MSTSNSVGSGLIGLGPNYGSQVHDALNNSTGDAVLDRIFQQNTSTPNYLTILLGRDDDPSDKFPGDLTIGEILPGYEAITSQTKLNVSQVSINDIGDQHWQTLLDSSGVIGPDGKAIDIETGVSTTSDKKQLTAVFDSGFSLPQVPAYAHDYQFRARFVNCRSQFRCRSDLRRRAWRRAGQGCFPWRDLDNTMRYRNKHIVQIRWKRHSHTSSGYLTGSECYRR